MRLCIRKEQWRRRCGREDLVAQVHEDGAQQGIAAHDKVKVCGRHFRCFEVALGKHVAELEAVVREVE